MSYLDLEKRPHGPPNPRPKPKARETGYMNPRLRNDTNFWIGWHLGWVCGLVAAMLIMMLVRWLIV